MIDGVSCQTLTPGLNAAAGAALACKRRRGLAVFVSEVRGRARRRAGAAPKALIFYPGIDGVSAAAILAPSTEGASDK